mmetsp:Transcript_7743/g.11672  ORF Transcript_7743/g.11672 Transcript_7743/m.11672 type:complete len:212 (-) Transcript_7743:34-669(-)
MCDHSGCSHDHTHGHDISHVEEYSSGDSLFGFIDTEKMRGLNICSTSNISNAVKPWERRREIDRYLKSNDDDAELLVFIPFVQAVKIRAISLLLGQDDSAPKSMKVWINREDIDFEISQTAVPIQTIELATSEIEINYPTKISKMQCVSNITLYFPENIGGHDLSSVVRFIGFLGESTSYRHGVVLAVYESKPMPSDHKQKDEDFANNSVL